MDYYAEQAARLASGETQPYRHPFDYGLGFMVNFVNETTGEKRMEVDYCETKEQHDEQRYVVEWFVNGEKTYTVSTVRANKIYDLAIPGEALLPVANNRWHVLMRQAALERIRALQWHESMTLAFQDPDENLMHDVERIVVRHEPAPDLHYE